MKRKLLYVVSILVLLFAMPEAHAGFLVKKAAVSTTGKVAVTGGAAQVMAHEGKSTFLERISNRVANLSPYRLHKQSQWVGIAAIFCGIIGLLVPGVNFLAILFGVLGMGRGCDVKGLAVAGFIMGMLELLLYVLIQATFVSLILL